MVDDRDDEGSKVAAPEIYQNRDGGKRPRGDNVPEGRVKLILSYANVILTQTTSTNTSQ